MLSKIKYKYNGAYQKLRYSTIINSSDFVLFGLSNIRHVTVFHEIK